MGDTSQLSTTDGESLSDSDHGPGMRNEGLGSFVTKGGGLKSKSGTLGMSRPLPSEGNLSRSIGMGGGLGGSKMKAKAGLSQLSGVGLAALGGDCDEPDHRRF